jgi:hypothetical protein
VFCECFRSSWCLNSGELRDNVNEKENPEKLQRLSGDIFESTGVLAVIVYMLSL